jgi:hypothetical protein
MLVLNNTMGEIPKLSAKLLRTKMQEKNSRVRSYY